MTIELYVHVRATGKAVRTPTLAEVGMIAYQGEVIHQACSLLIKPMEADIIPPMWSTVTHEGNLKHGLPLNYIMPVVRKMLVNADVLYAYDAAEEVALLDMMHNLCNYELRMPIDRNNVRPSNVTMFQHMAAIGVCGVLRKHHLSTLVPADETQDMDRRSRRRGGRGGPNE